MTKDEALKLALEALSSGEETKANGIGWLEYDCRLVKQAITAIKEALAQPEKKRMVNNCKHEWIDETKDHPQWRCIKCGENYLKENT